MSTPCGFGFNAKSLCNINRHTQLAVEAQYMNKIYIPQGDLHLDRSQLPQVRSKDIPDYLQWLRDNRGYTYARLELPVGTLYPSQSNFNQSKIRSFMKQQREDLRQPIIVSADNYVMDGHHRWIALLNKDNRDTVQAIVILAKIRDLIAATKQYPKSTTKGVLESFAVLTEAAEKHAVLAFGRMNPPTTGHAKLVDKVHEVAQAHDAHHEVVLSHSEDAKKNPLSQAQKVKHAKRFFPHTNITSASKSEPTIFHHAARLHEAGHKHLHVIAGEDRVKEFSHNLHKYNGHFDKEGHGYKFKSITVHSAGKRDPEAKGTEGMSASKMREHASKGHFHEFKKGIPSHVKPEHAKELYHDVRKGQGLNEEVEYLMEHVADAGIFKAVFLAGTPGSGKDIVLKKALQGHGMTEVNSDAALNHLTDKEHLDGKMSEGEQDRRNAHTQKAKSLQDLRQRLAIHGRNGLVINSTHADHGHIKKIKDKLEKLGYDSKMVFVDASDNVSRNRNVERGQKGGRMLPERDRAEKWRKAQDARVKLAKEFGGEHYHEFSNDEDLRQGADPEVAGEKTSELQDLHKTIKKWTQTPPKSEEAQKWVYSKISKQAKAPIGNKIQQSKVLPPPADSKAKEEAQTLGLTYYGNGKYGKDKRVTHFAIHDRLIEKLKALKPPVDKDAKKKKTVNEEFELFLLEDTDESLPLPDHMDFPSLVTEDTGVVLPLQHLTDSTSGTDVCESGESEGDTWSDHDGHSDSDLGTYGSVAAGSLQEEEEGQEKVSFDAFRRRLVVPGAQEKEINEANAVDTMETGGPALGGSPAESQDLSNGGTATSVPKKTLEQFKKEFKHMDPTERA